LKEEPIMKRPVRIPGSTTIPNCYLEALMARHMSGTELQVVLALTELTIGQGRETVQISSSELALRLRSTAAVVGHTLKGLREAGLVVRSGRVGDSRGMVYRLVPDPTRWAPSEKVPGVRMQVLERDNETCVYCGKSVPGKMCVDHVIPRSLGGSQGAHNLVTSCEQCNYRKAALGFEEFLTRDPTLREKFLPLIIWYRAKNGPADALEEAGASPPPEPRPRRRPHCPLLDADCPLRGELPRLAGMREGPWPMIWRGKAQLP